MAVKIADISVALGLDDSAYLRGLSNAQGRATAFGGILTGIFQGLGQQLFRGIVDGLETVVSKMGAAVMASSDLNESINKSGVVFGSASASILEWSQTTDKSMGLSQRATLEAAGSFGALFRQMGALPDVAAANSKELVQVAADLASIYNIPVEAALEKIQSGLVGMSRPLREVNIFLTENSVAQKAVQLGLASSTAAVSEAAKVEARRAIILEQAGIAQGDFARTSHNLANAQRILSAEMENGAARLGNVFRPAVEAITNSLVDLAPQMFGYASNIMDQFAAGLAAGIRALLPAIRVIEQLFAYWLKPGSPPKILPNIAKWGMGAMKAYLDGFSSVDVKSAFDTVGRAIETILRSSVNAGKSSEGGLVSAIFGTRAAILQAVSEFAQVGNVSEATINKIVRSAGVAGPGIAALVKAYFELQKASTAATRAQDELNRITEQYDAILNPLRGKLDDVRAQQQKLANQQRLIADQNVLTNFDSTVAEKKAAQLDIEQIALEDQIAATEKQKKAATDTAQANVDGAKKTETAAQKQLDAAQAVIDQQVESNNLIGEQIALEKRLADERKTEAEKQQRLAEQLHQAQLQYQLGIATTEGKLAILRGELANTTAGTTEYYNILGQIATLEKQAADEAKRNAEKVSNAQLDYNLALADTPGKIAIMQGELAKATVGSAEYFNILTKIHDLTVQYNKELAKSAGGDIGAGLTGAIGPMPKLPETPGGKNLAAAITEAMAAFEKAGPASEHIQKLADAINSVVTALGKLTGIDLSSFFGKQKEATQIGVGGWNDYGLTTFKNAADAQKNAEETQTKVNATIDSITEKIKVFKTFIDGDWKQLWLDYKNYALTANSDFDKDTQAKLDHIELVMKTFRDVEHKDWGGLWSDLGGLASAFWGGILKFNSLFTTQWGLDQRAWMAGVLKDWAKWLGDMSSKVAFWITDVGGSIERGFTKLGTSFYNGGIKMIAQFGEGLKSGWGGVETWFKDKIGWLGAQFPHSEPKDPSSPLRGMKQSGTAMVNMFQSGMNAASLTVQPLANQLLAPAGATTTNNHSSNMVFHINISAGNGDLKAIGAASEDAVLRALRAAGMA